jgi:hypothetical protein
MRWRPGSAITLAAARNQNADAQQQRGEERPGDAGGSSDRYDDQEVDHEFEREDRVEAEDLRPQRTAQPGEPGADREGDGKHLVDVDAEPARDARVVDRRAQPAAEARARKDELQRDRQQPADHDDQKPVFADADAEDVDLAG